MLVPNGFLDTAGIDAVDYSGQYIRLSPNKQMKSRTESDWETVKLKTCLRKKKRRKKANGEPSTTSLGLNQVNRFKQIPLASPLSKTWAKHNEGTREQFFREIHGRATSDDVTKRGATRLRTVALSRSGAGRRLHFRWFSEQRWQLTISWRGVRLYFTAMEMCSPLLPLECYYADNKTLHHVTSRSRDF